MFATSKTKVFYELHNNQAHQSKRRSLSKLSSIDLYRPKYILKRYINIHLRPYRCVCVSVYVKFYIAYKHIHTYIHTHTKT